MDPDYNKYIAGFGLPPAAQRWFKNVPESFNASSFLNGAELGKDELESLLVSFYFAGIVKISEKDDNFPFGGAYLDMAAKRKAEAEKKAKLDSKKTPAKNCCGNKAS